MGPPDDLDQLAQPGQILAGKYRIERVIGKGGMGVVVAAHHLQLDEKVAIKFLLPAAVARADLLARFEREARAAVKIKNEHVARVIDVGVLETGSPFMVMEFLDGMDLAARITAEGRLSVAETADWVLQACEAIVEAHALGIVHRDLKPANLFITRGADGLESIKVLDFGISKSSGMSGSTPGSDMTQTQSMLGSPFYMSPEQMQSARSVDMRTDIWALGCILYQCLAGEVPFEAETLPELVLKIVQSSPRPIHQVRSDVPAALEQVIAHCLQKDRDQRYPHVGELARGLMPFAPERARSSAERVLRVVQTSGMGQGMPPRLPSSAPRMETAKLASPVDTGATGPGLRSPSQSEAPPRGAPGAGATVGMGPPPNTLPPGAKSTGSNPTFGVTSGSGSWGKTSNEGLPRKNRGIAVLAISGALLVILLLGSGAFVAGRHLFASQQGAAPADAAPPATAPLDATPPAATSAAVVPSVIPSAAPSEEPIVPEDAGNVAAADAAPITTLTPMPAPAPIAPPPVPVGPTPQPPTGKPSAASCNPPYYYDDKGNKVFKKECL